MSYYGLFSSLLMGCCTGECYIYIQSMYYISTVTWRTCVAIFLLFCFSLNVLSMLYGHFWYLLDSGRNNVHMTLGPDLSLLLLLCYLKLLADHPRFNLREDFLFPLINLIHPRFNLTDKAVAALLLGHIPSSALYGNFILCFRATRLQSFKKPGGGSFYTVSTSSSTKIPPSAVSH